MPEVDLSPEGRKRIRQTYTTGIGVRRAGYETVLAPLDRLEALEKVAEAARALAKSNQGHFESEDCYYSCPAHEDYCGHAGKDCACYFHEAEALRAALRSLDAGHPPAGEDPCAKPSRARASWSPSWSPPMPADPPSSGEASGGSAPYSDVLARLPELREIAEARLRLPFGLLDTHKYEATFSPPTVLALLRLVEEQMEKIDRLEGDIDDCDSALHDLHLRDESGPGDLPLSLYEKCEWVTQHIQEQRAALHVLAVDATSNGSCVFCGEGEKGRALVHHSDCPILLYAVPAEDRGERRGT